MVWPQTVLGTKFELFYNGIWNNHSSSVRGIGAQEGEINIGQRGQPDESTGVVTTVSHLSLNNKNGRFSPRNVASDLYGLLGPNTPARISTDVSDSHSVVDSFNDNGTNGWPVADSGHTWLVDGTASEYLVNAGLAIHRQNATGVEHFSHPANLTPSDFDMYINGITIAATPTGNSVLVSARGRYNVTGGLGEYVEAQLEFPTGAGSNVRLKIRQIKNFGAIIIESPSFNVANTLNNAPVSLRFQAYGRDLRCKAWQTSNVEPEDWQYETTTDLILTPGPFGVVSLLAPGNSNTTPYDISFDSIEFILGIVLQVGEVSSWPKKWDTTGNDVWVTIEISGITRRLTQGARPIRSPLYRAFSKLNLLGYYSFEDLDPNILYNEIPSDLQNGQTLKRAPGIPVAKVEWSGDNSLAGASNLPRSRLGADPVGVTQYIGTQLLPASNVHNQFSVVVWNRVPLALQTGIGDIFTQFRVVIGITNSPQVGIWNLQIRQEYVSSVSQIALTATARSPTDTLVTLQTTGNQPFVDDWRMVRFTIDQSGGNIRIRFYIDEVLITTATPVVAATGQPISINLMTIETDHNDQFNAFGHWAIASGQNTDDIAANAALLRSASLGWNGENAVVRARRIFEENNIPLRIIDVVNATASDDWQRVIANGWGNAVLGGPWILTTAAQTNFEVNNFGFGLEGRIKCSAVNNVSTAMLPNQATDVEIFLGHFIGIGALVSAGAQISAAVFARCSTIQMSFGTSSYILGELLFNTGVDTVTARIVEVISNVSNTVLATFATGLAGSTVAFAVRLRCIGPNVYMKVWDSGTAEPAGWQLTGVTTLTTPGYCGIWEYLNVGNTNTLPVQFSVQNMVITDLGAPTTLMGPQPKGAIIDLAVDTVNADDGIFCESRSELGYVFRTRSSLLGATSKLTIDYDATDLSEVETTDDDQKSRNRVVAQRTTGQTIAIVEQTSGPMSVNDPTDNPPGIGLYETKVQANLYADDQLADYAGHRVLQGSWDESRWPAMGVQLERAPFTGVIANLTHLASAAFLEVAELYSIINSPSWIGPDAIILQMRSVSLFLSNFSWGIDWTAIPGGPFSEIGQVGNVAYGRLDTTDSELAIAVNTTDTDLYTFSNPDTSILPYEWGLWTEDPGELNIQNLGTIQANGFDLRINAATRAGGRGGERVTVAGSPTAFDTFTRGPANIAGTNADSGQTWVNTQGASASQTVTGTRFRMAQSSVNTAFESTLPVGSGDHCVTVDLYQPYGAAVGATIDHQIRVRYIDNNNHYRATLTLTTGGRMQLVMRKTQGGVATIFTPNAFDVGAHSAGIPWRFKVAIWNQYFAAKAWRPDLGPEPDWQWIVNDWPSPMYGSGTSIGLLTILNTGNTNTLPDNIEWDNLNVYARRIRPAYYDRFNRTVASGLGSADFGGSYTLIGAGGSVLTSDYSVAPYSASTLLPAAPSYRSAQLQSISLVDAIVSVTWSCVQATGGNLEPGNILMRGETGGGTYNIFRTTVSTTNVVTMEIYNHAGSLLGSQIVFGITHTGTGQPLRNKAAAVGNTLMMKCWNPTQPEPTHWQLVVTDADTPISGFVGWRNGKAAANTNVNPTPSVSDFRVDSPQTITVARSSNGAVKSWPIGASVRLWNPIRLGR